MLASALEYDSRPPQETLKYLYLLFSEPAAARVNLDQFVFTTEAHILPLHGTADAAPGLVEVAAYDPSRPRPPAWWRAVSSEAPAPFLDEEYAQPE